MTPDEMEEAMARALGDNTTADKIRLRRLITPAPGAPSSGYSGDAAKTLRDHAAQLRRLADKADAAAAAIESSR